MWVHLCVWKKEVGGGLLPHHRRGPSLGNPACSMRPPSPFQQPSHSSHGTSPFLSEKTKREIWLTFIGCLNHINSLHVYSTFFYYDQSPYNSYKLVTSNLFLFMNSEYASPDKIKKYSSEDVNKGATPFDLVMLITLLFALNN